MTACTVCDSMMMTAATRVGRPEEAVKLYKDMLAEVGGEVGFG